MEYITELLANLPKNPILCWGCYTFSVGLCMVKASAYFPDPEKALEGHGYLFIGVGVVFFVYEQVKPIV